jgi:hypothetical protein
MVYARQARGRYGVTRREKDTVEDTGERRNESEVRDESGPPSGSLSGPGEPDTVTEGEGSLPVHKEPLPEPGES